MPSSALRSRRATILVVGDSLSAEYGLVRGSGWVALLEQRLAREHIDATVVNASISGDTTAGGLARLPALLRERKPGLVVIELGGNDALRGLPLETTRANLLAMARLAKAAGAKVLILGMQLPPNYGRAYGDRFAAIFADVARSEGAALVPVHAEGRRRRPAGRVDVPGRPHPPAGERAPDDPRQRLAGAGAAAEVARRADATRAYFCFSAFSSRRSSPRPRGASGRFILPSPGGRCASGGRASGARWTTAGGAAGGPAAAGRGTTAASGARFTGAGRCASAPRGASTGRGVKVRCGKVPCGIVP